MSLDCLFRWEITGYMTGLSKVSLARMQDGHSVGMMDKWCMEVELWAGWMDRWRL